jgi:sialate O-acetylesterase
MHNMAPSVALLVAVAAVLLASADAARFSLASYFGNDMVFQRGAPIPVWGWAPPGQTV